MGVLHLKPCVPGVADIPNILPAFWVQRRAAFRPCPPCKAELASNMPRNIRGERDATQAETTSGFAEKPLGFYDTAHIIRGPDGLLHLVGLSAREIREDAPVLDETDLNKLRNQTPGWKLLSSESGGPYLKQEWTAKDAASAKEMVSRIQLIADEASYSADVQITGDVKVSADLTGQSKGGLTETDFIVASRINAINFKDLKPKPRARYWA